MSWFRLKKGYDLCVCGHQRFLHYAKKYCQRGSTGSCSCSKFFYDDRLVLDDDGTLV